MLIEDVPGTFSVGHPQSCEALLRHAEQAGARVVRGVGDVDVTPGSTPSVSYEVDGNVHVQSARLVVAADGRQSTIRRQLGIELQQVASKASLGGMLVRDDEWPHEVEVLGTEGDVHFLVFPRPNGFVRLYLARDINADVGRRRARASGSSTRSRLECCPAAASLAKRRDRRAVRDLPGHRLVDRSTVRRRRGLGR